MYYLSYWMYCRYALGQDNFVFSAWLRLWFLHRELKHVSIPYEGNHLCKIKVLQFRLGIFFKLGLERKLMVWMSPNDILSFVVLHMFLSNVPCDITYKTNVHISPHFGILILNNNTVYFLYFPIMFLQEFCCAVIF